jgi:hypothetical protein
MESYMIKEERNTTANEQLEITPFINGKGNQTENNRPPPTNEPRGRGGGNRDEDELL